MKKRIDLNKVCEDSDIKVRAYSDPKIADVMKELQLSTSCSAYAIVARNGAAILYDDSRMETEVRFTLAHELGHILLGHLSFREGIGEYPEHMETEANIFAAVLMAHDILFAYGEEDTV